jgi:hypothetical protein
MATPGIAPGNLAGARTNVANHMAGSWAGSHWPELTSINHLDRLKIADVIVREAPLARSRYNQSLVFGVRTGWG